MSERNSTSWPAEKPPKPYPEFPLFPQVGRIVPTVEPPLLSPEGIIAFDE
jgi:hypothetical protein